jgi:hypothetical protein
MPKYEIRIWKGLPFQNYEIMRVFGKNAEEQKMPEDIQTSGTNLIG